jgi:hypothetical protein
MEVRRIWDKAPHNGFTDLVFHLDRWWCILREATSHPATDGSLRVITSVDGDAWESATRLKIGVEDLRHPKLVVTPNGEFMASAACELLHAKTHSLESYVWFSNDGRKWSDAIRVCDPNYLLWRVTWHEDLCYGIAYDRGEAKNIRLYQSLDGRHFDALVENLYDVGYPNQNSIVFLPDNTALCLVRRDSEPVNGLLGISRPPYREWEWKDIGVQIGGPDMLALPDGRLVACVRLYQPRQRTGLGLVDRQSGRFTEFLELPSDGDNGYAGMVWRDNLLWVSYYSSHEEKTAIYLAKVPL